MRRRQSGLIEVVSLHHLAFSLGQPPCEKPLPAKPEEMIRPLGPRSQYTYTRDGYVGGRVNFTHTIHSSAPAWGSPQPGLVTRDAAVEGTGDITQRRGMPAHEAYHTAHLLIEGFEMTPRT